MSEEETMLNGPGVYRGIGSAFPTKIAPCLRLHRTLVKTTFFALRQPIVLSLWRGPALSDEMTRIKDAAYRHLL